MKRLLRPFGYVGNMLLGMVVAYFFHEKIKEQVEKIVK
jgi:hypothetical protein